MDTIEQIDLDFLTQLVELDDWKCGDRNHPAGASYHTAEAPAEFMIVGPCCGDRGLLCRSRAYYLKHQAATIHCMRCDRHWSPDRYRFVPLPGALPL